MIFNSFTFLCFFLPIVMIGFFQCHGRAAGKLWLLGASLVFYFGGKWQHAPWLVASLVVNYAVAQRLLQTAKEPDLRRRWLISGILFNVIFLAVCKYTNFVLSTANALVATHFPHYSLPFPLGVSFFVIQEVAFLVDVYQDLIPQITGVDFALFVTFFPRVSSGPILDYRETVSEFDKPAVLIPNAHNIATGLMLLFMGLGKKVLIADTLSYWTQQGFREASALTFFEAWSMVMCFTFQIYFDFSGYSDMAVGLARLLNIRIPNNFNSPYQATSIIDFWNRWHISLTRFVTSYLYTPLLRSFQVLTLPKALGVTLVSMTLIGLWHGPAWTFVIFGAIHGTALVLNRIARHLKWHVPDAVGWLLTFLVVNVGFVFFRSEGIGQALEMLKGMAGFRGISLSHRFAHYLYAAHWPMHVQVEYWHSQGQGTVFTLLPFLLAFVFLKHNSTEEEESFAPTLRRLAALTLLIFFGLLNLHQYAPFVYVNF